MWLLLLLHFISLCSGKVVNGLLNLNSVTTELELAKFSFNKNAEGLMQVNFTVVGEGKYFDFHPHDLRIVMFTDTQHAKFLKMTEDGTLCKERAAVAGWTEKIAPKKQSEDLTFTVGARIHKNQFRTHYVYFWIMDCYLEEYEAHPPTISFEMTLRNGASHLPADEEGMLLIHGLLLCVMILFGIFFYIKLFRQLKKMGQVHLIGVLTFFAFLLQTGSVVCECLHLLVYSANGKGLRFRHTFFALDFASEVFQMLSENIITLILLAVGAGWTLNIPVEIDPETGTPGVEKKLHGFKALTIKGLMISLRKPFDMLKGADIIPLLAFLTIFFLQIFLEFAGRQYEDDFNSFHDHEHWPGFALMFMRISFGIFFFFFVSKTLKDPAITDEKMKYFLKVLLVSGLVYFWAFPFVVFISSWWPAYQRHTVVTTGSICAQTSGLLMMMFTFLSETGAFAKISHAVNLKENKKSSARQTSFGLGRRRKKVAVD